MFETILVPLDGSKLAECALGYAETIAKSCSASELILVSVTEKVKGFTSAAEMREALKGSGDINLAESQRGAALGENVVMPGGPVNSAVPYVRGVNRTDGTVVTFGKMEKQAEKYLERIQDKLEAKGIPVKIEVLIGNPAERITKYADDAGVNLIVMSSHGRSGPSRWAMGSVSDKVFRATSIPVLLIRAPGCTMGA